MSKKKDIGTIVALSWAGVAIGVTLVFGPLLGLRGWAWLIAHHVLCAIGVTHELWRARKRRRGRTG